jgi:phosphatidylethanolamine/phosphatidyl-N-methylethanolamine N-methyltransferase
MPAIRDYGRFAVEFIKTPRTTGAIAPSSRALAERMLEGLDLNSASAVCEFGPGTGSFTELILERIGAKTKFFAIEKSPAMVDALRLRFPQLRVYQESIVDVDKCCQSEGVDALDAVICGLPWASFDASFQEAGLAATCRALKPGGRFVTFAYSIGTWLPAGWRFARTVRRHFTTVTKSKVVWTNLPPAFVYRCVK